MIKGLKQRGTRASWISKGSQKARHFGPAVGGTSLLCGTEGALLCARLPEREAIPRLLDKVTKRHGVPPRDAYLSVGSPTEQDGSKSGSGRGRPRAPSWRRLRFCRLRTGQCPAVTISCCRLSLGIVQPCAGCRLSRSCISRIWISRTRAGPGQAAPPRGAAGAPPRPPCREGS